MLVYGILLAALGLDAETARAQSAAAYRTEPILLPAPEAPPPAAASEATNWGLLGPGIALLAGGWAVSGVATSLWYSTTTSCVSTGILTNHCTHDGGPSGWGLLWSFLPVLGPWLVMTDPHIDSHEERIFPVIMGLAQLTGLVLVIVGAATPETRGPSASADDSWPRVSIAPTQGGAMGTVEIVL